MQLRVLGSAGTYPTPGGPASGYLVTAGSSQLWCDAGPGTFTRLAAVTAPEELDAVVVSHMHIDHCLDLFVLIHYLAYGPPGGGVAIDVYAPADAAERFEAFLRPGSGHPFYEVLRFREATASSPGAVGDITVEFAEATHSIPAWLTRFEAAGRSLVYTGDTGPTPELERLAANADVLVAEASLGPEDDPYPFHLTPAQAGAVAAAAGVGRLVLTHLRPTLDPAVAAARAEATFGRAPTVATPGMQLTI